MKTIYVISLPIIILFSILGVISCSKKDSQLEAKTYLSKARESYYALDFDKANIILDSLPILYPQAYETRRIGKWLKDSIARTKSEYKIDSISAEINQYKIDIIKMKRSNTPSSKINLIELKMDSLEELKKPFKVIINAVTKNELQYAARTQCVTCLQ